MQHLFQPGPRVTIILPFKLPTWNDMLTFDFRRRLKVKKFIRDFVSTTVKDAGGSSMPMGCTLKPQLTVSQLEAYLTMIDRNGSSPSRNPKKRRT
jgi:hypothetical protein